MLEEFLKFKSEKEKKDILQWLTIKNIKCEEITIENLVNIISCCKNNLNEEIKYCEQLTGLKSKDSLYNTIVKAKNNKLDYLIDLYNDSNTYNKITFKNNSITFSKTTFLKKIKLEIDSFDYSVPINYSISFFTYDGEEVVYNIIPYNYNGLFTEYIGEGVSQSLFKVANKNTIYFYNCTYNENGFVLGKELSLEKKVAYDFQNGYIVFDRDKIDDKELFIKYQPNQNSFEFDINKKIIKIDIKAINDKMDIDKNYTKRLVIF